MLAALEVYNKPRITYRDECFVILLLNAWELVLKALLSRNGKSIFYPKRRGEAYRTLSWRDALIKADTFFPKDLPSLAIRRNLDLLGTYRDNSVHFYNAKGFGTIIYALAQTSIVNFNDLVWKSFKVDVAREVSWDLLPLGLKPPIDPIEYISQAGTSQSQGTAAVRQFLAELATATQEVEKVGGDTGRLMTVFKVKLESTKKIEKADVVVGVQPAGPATGPLAILKTQDPNITHPLRTMDVVGKVKNLDGKPFTPFVFQSLVWRYDVRTKPQHCWRATEGVLTRYSNEVITWIRSLPPTDVEAAISAYKVHLKRPKAKGTAPSIQ